MKERLCLVDKVPWPQLYLTWWTSPAARMEERLSAARNNGCRLQPPPQRAAAAAAEAEVEAVAVARDAWRIGERS